MTTYIVESRWKDYRMGWTQWNHVCDADTLDNGKWTVRELEKRFKEDVRDGCIGRWHKEEYRVRKV